MLGRVLGLLMLFFSGQVFADFSIEGKLALQFADGQQQQLLFPIQLFHERGNLVFSVGSQQTQLNAPLQKYSLAVILQENDHEVLVSDFASKPLHSFKLEIAGHAVELHRDASALEARGRYVLKLNDEKFYFSRGPGQINFIFNDQGITELQVKGMARASR